MSIDPDVIQQTNVAFENGNVEEFRSLITAFPQLLRHKNGADRWMWRAAMTGNLPMIEALVSLGMDVNESKDRIDAQNPFSEAEGAILWAASEGHTEVVKWFLDHGAKINYEIKGKTRCLPLQFAATEGHLDVVKILVERGAEVHSSWNGLTATQQADNFGHFEVRDFLRSLGG